MRKIISFFPQMNTLTSWFYKRYVILYHHVVLMNRGVNPFSFGPLAVRQALMKVSCCVSLLSLLVNSWGVKNPSSGLFWRYNFRKHWRNRSNRNIQPKGYWFSQDLWLYATALSNEFYKAEPVYSWSGPNGETIKNPINLRNRNARIIQEYNYN